MIDNFAIIANQGFEVNLYANSSFHFVFTVNVLPHM